MATQTYNRQRSSRGGRRRSRRGSRGSSNSPAKPVKQTLWQRIVSFFTGKKATTRSNDRPRSNRLQHPAEAGPSPASTERPAIRKPELVEVTTPRVYVGNLSFDATESDLLELFSGVGKVQNVEIVTNRHTQRSKGFGFVQMTAIEEAKRAVEVLHDKEYMGRKLVVSGAKLPAEGRQERDRQPEQ